MTATGQYWAIASSTAGASLARTGAKNPKFPLTAIRFSLCVS
jgi:hypothetical protein